MLTFKNQSFDHHSHIDGKQVPFYSADYYCLSTDNKPSNPVSQVANGTILYEMDTRTFYCFDEANNKWWPMNTEV